MKNTSIKHKCSILLFQGFLKGAPFKIQIEIKEKLFETAVTVTHIFCSYCFSTFPLFTFFTKEGDFFYEALKQLRAKYFLVVYAFLYVRLYTMRIQYDVFVCIFEFLNT